MSIILCDPSAERAVLAGICRYGEDAFLDVADIVQESTFTIDSNGILFKCLKSICDKGHSPKIDMASIYSAAQDEGVSHILAKKEEAQHLKAIMDFPVSRENVRKFAGKIRKLEIARLLKDQLAAAQDSILEVTGNESIAAILNIAEEKIFDFTSLLNDVENNPISIGKDLSSYIEYLASNYIS